MTGRERRLKVVWLCLEWPSETHSGGVARYAHRLARQIAEHVDLTIVTEEGGAALVGADMIYLPRSRGRFDRYYGHAVRARRAVRSVADADVVHSFGDDWALGRGRWRRVRHFLGLSISEARTSTGLRKLNHYLLALLEKYSQWLADYKIGIGPESYREFRCDTIMPPVVPTASFEAERSPAPSVVFIGSFTGRKRGDWVLDAVNESSRRLNTEVSLTVFGPSSDATNWPPEVRHIAGADDEAVQRGIASAWVLLAPSSYEGFGIPTFEALSLGTSAIATANPGSSFQATEVGDDRCLRIVDTAEDLSRALTETLREGPRMPDAARESGRRAVMRLLDLASAERLLRIAYRADQTS